MEYCEDGTLEHLINKKKALDEHLALQILSQIILALTVLIPLLSNCIVRKLSILIYDQNMFCSIRASIKWLISDYPPRSCFRKIRRIEQRWAVSNG